MADVMKLLNPGDSNFVTFSPLAGYTFPQQRARSKNFSLDGTLYIYEWSTMIRHELKINNVGVLSSNYINTWWEGRTLLWFYYDLITYPTTYKLVKIFNSTRPMQYMPPTFSEDSYEGDLILQEVTS